MKKPVVLRIYKGEQLLGARQFVEPQIVFGRTMPDSEAQVTLDGESVSLIHASIEEREEGKYFVCDLGSVGGTKINDKSVLDSPIESGDVLEIGDYRIEFYIGAPKPKTGQTVVGYQLPKTEKTTVAPASVAAPVAATPPPAPPEASQPAFPTPTPQPAAPAAPPVTPPPAPTPVAAPPPAPTPPPPVPPAPKAPPPTAPPSAAAPPPAKPPTPNVVPMTPPPTAANQFKPKPIPRTPPPAAPRPPLPQPSASAGMAGATVSSAKPRADHSKSKNRKTFAPPSRFQDVRDYIKPSKGTVIEVLVAWRERIIATYHFSQAQTVTMGSHPDNDIVLPLLNMQVRKLPILKIDKQAIVLVGADMRGEVVRGQTSSSFDELRRQNRLGPQGLPLDQGEMARIELSDQVSLIIRYVSDSPKPLIAPLLDFTAAETTGVVLALALVATLWLTMSIYHPAKDLEPESQEPMRTAQIVLTPPTPPPLPKVEPPPPEPEPPKPPPTPVPTPPPPPPKKVKVEVSNKTQEHKASPKAATNLTKKNDPGMSANAVPNKNKTGPRTLTSPKQGGAIKTSKVEGSQMKSKNRDMSKSGIFSAFANGGQNDQLAQSTTGSGELAGMADSATGKAGSAVDRSGKGLGSDLKDTGAGGTGTALKGIVGGVGTTGRGSGNTGYGTGGLGTHQGTKIVTGGTGEMIKGTIDREAIRRVIVANLKSIRACYEKELNRHPELYGKLVLGWDIGEQGRVLAARVKSNELGSREVADCILAKLKTWRFPDPPANQVVEIEAYPFLFSN